MINAALEEFAPIVRDLIGVPASELFSADAAERMPGSYLLLLGLAAPLTIHIKKRDWRLSAGLFVYAGSAHGAGGLKSRLARHFLREKKQHWHIDRVTLGARAMRALCYQARSECSCARGFSPAVISRSRYPASAAATARTAPHIFWNSATLESGKGLKKTSQTGLG